MVKTVFDLLSEIYDDNIDKLPNKIKVDSRIYYKNSLYDDYFTEPRGKGGNEILSDLREKNWLKDILTLPVEEVEEGKWKPKIGEEYWYAYDCDPFITKAIWNNSKLDNYRYYLNICFRTTEEAKQHQENIITEVELRQLAEELNNGGKIDWKDTEQEKYYLYYDSEDEEIYTDYTYMAKFPKQIYCLDGNFKERAIEQIGEEKLKNYLMEE